MSNQTIYQALRGAGLTAEGACGMMGNMKAESSMKSNIAQRGMTTLSDEAYTQAANRGEINFASDGVGYGLCQWTYGPRKKALLEFARSKGTSVGDEDMQVQFCIKELQDYPGVLSVLKTSHDLKRCSDIVCTEFERPAENNLDIRYRFSQEFYDEFDHHDTSSSGFGSSFLTYPQSTQKPVSTKPEVSTAKSQSSGIFAHLFGGNTASSGVKMKSASMPVLKEGDTGAGVAAVQAALAYHRVSMGDAGEYGKYGAGTVDGVKEFQRRNGLKVTGEMTPETWSRLMQ